MPRVAHRRRRSGHRPRAALRRALRPALRGALRRGTGRASHRVARGARHGRGAARRGAGGGPRRAQHVPGALPTDLRGRCAGHQAAAGGHRQALALGRAAADGQEPHRVGAQVLHLHLIAAAIRTAEHLVAHGPGGGELVGGRKKRLKARSKSGFHSTLDLFQHGESLV